MTVLACLREPCLEATRTAFAFQGVRLSRGELFGRAQQFAQAMQARGLRPGERVGLLMANPAVHATCLLGLSLVGAVGVAVQASWMQQVGNGPFASLGLLWLVHDRRDVAALQLPPGCQAVSAREVFAPASAERLATPVHPASGSSVDLSQPWLLSMSSGTTGEPKCVVTSQSAFMASLQMGEQFQAEDRVFLFLEHSMYWAFATACRALLAGAQAVFQPPSILPAQLLQMLHDAQASVLVLSADAASKVASYLMDFAAQCPELHLTRVVIGGGRVSHQVRGLFQARWGAQVLVLYGSTEMGPMAIWRQGAQPDAADDYLLSPYDGVEVQVVDAMGQSLSPEDLGYLRLRSAAMFSGYLDDSGQLPAQAPQWFYPGDMAVMTRDGQIRLEGRSDHVLNLGGRKIDPEQIEQVIRSNPCVADAAVTRAVMGGAQVEVLVALLVLKNGADLATVKASCSEALPLAQRPEYFVAVPDLPRNLSGKLQRQRLAQMVRIERH